MNNRQGFKLHLKISEKCRIKFVHKMLHFRERLAWKCITRAYGTHQFIIKLVFNYVKLYFPENEASSGKTLYFTFLTCFHPYNNLLLIVHSYLVKLKHTWQICETRLFKKKISKKKGSMKKCYSIFSTYFFFYLDSSSARLNYDTNPTLYNTHRQYISS